MAAPEKACKVCGCTDDRACGPSPCTWVIHRPALCSGCVVFLLNIQDPQRQAAAIKFFGVQRFTSPDRWREILGEWASWLAV